MNMKRWTRSIPSMKVYVEFCYFDVDAPDRPIQDFLTLIASFREPCPAYSPAIGATLLLETSPPWLTLMRSDVFAKRILLEAATQDPAAGREHP